jgi:cobaltochelatase CobS
MQTDIFGVELTISEHNTHETGVEHIPHLDENYVMREEESRQIAFALRDDERLLLVGPTGTGKSSHVEQIAHKANWPLYRVAASSGLTEGDFIGEWIVKDQETVFNYGILVHAMRKGGILLVDEADGLPPEVGLGLHQVMEEDGYLTITQNSDEVVYPHEDFRIVATANTLGKGNRTGLYTGTHVINAAFMDRIGTVIDYNYPTKQVEMEILRKKAPGLGSQMVERLVDYGRECRQAYEGQKCTFVVSTRRLIHLAQKIVQQAGNVNKAFKLSLFNRLEANENITTLGEVAQRRLNIVYR